MGKEYLAVKPMPDEQLMIRYLLGELTEEEQARLEERLFADDEFYEHLQALKAELADDYARGELAEGERARFEERFLTSPQGRERAAFAAAMTVALPEVRAAAAATPVTASAKTISWWQSWRAFLQARSLALQFSLAAAVLVLALGGLWLALETRRLHAEVAQARAEREAAERQQQGLEQQTAQHRARNDELAAQLEREQAERKRLQEELAQSPARPSAFLSFVLVPGLVRGTDEPAKLIIPRAAQEIRLQLDLNGDDQYRSFRAEARTARGNLVWSQDGLMARTTDAGKAVFLNLPASVLTNGEYELTLKGILSQGKLEDVGYYYFAVLKR
jgi:hypothetical protein